MPQSLAPGNYLRTLRHILEVLDHRVLFIKSEMIQRGHVRKSQSAGLGIIRFFLMLSAAPSSWIEWQVESSER